MRIAIPTAAGRLVMHFGHCDEFTFVDVDPEKKAILTTQTAAPPEHQPGVLPVWLSDRGVQIVIAGGMGMRAQGLFADRDIQVVVGAPAEEPEAIVKAYLDGSLQTGANVCDH